MKFLEEESPNWRYRNLHEILAKTEHMGHTTKANTMIKSVILLSNSLCEPFRHYSLSNSVNATHKVQFYDYHVSERKAAQGKK